MIDLDNWHEIWSAISHNKARSFFTGFGVFWGVFMLIILLGVGNSLSGGMKANLSGFASNSCFFWSGQTSEAYKGYKMGRGWQLDNKDVDLIRKNATALGFVSPVIYGNGTGQNVLYQQKSGSFGIHGVYPEEFSVVKQEVLAGRTFNDIDLNEYRKSCVIGKLVSEALFNSPEGAIGKYIKVNGIYMQVIGVVKPQNSKIQINGDPQSTVYFPFTTMQRMFNYGDKVHLLTCTVSPNYPASMLEDQIKKILRKNHDISPTDDKAIGSFNLEEQVKPFTALFTGIDILVWIVGMGALLSGIIGISNIMLVTVKERTREIGVRRALGAKPIWVITQIMSESLVLTAIAGFLGYLAGLGILQLITVTIFSGPTPPGFFIAPLISLSTAISALTIIIIAGLLAGLMPALRALQIKAIDAIRDE